MLGWSVETSGDFHKCSRVVEGQNFGSTTKREVPNHGTTGSFSVSSGPDQERPPDGLPERRTETSRCPQRKTEKRGFRIPDRTVRPPPPQFSTKIPLRSGTWDTFTNPLLI